MLSILLSLPVLTQDFEVLCQEFVFWRHPILDDDEEQEDEEEDEEERRPEEAFGHPRPDVAWRGFAGLPRDAIVSETTMK